jgi:hypothetical protein
MFPPTIRSSDVQLARSSNDTPLTHQSSTEEPHHSTPSRLNPLCTTNSSSLTLNTVLPFPLLYPTPPPYQASTFAFFGLTIQLNVSVPLAFHFSGTGVSHASTNSKPSDSYRPLPLSLDSTTDYSALVLPSRCTTNRKNQDYLP